MLGDGTVAEEVSRHTGGLRAAPGRPGTPSLCVSLKIKCVIMLLNPTLTLQGTHDDLLALGGRYAEMWNMQLNSTRGNRSAGSLTSMSQLES